MSQTDQFYPSAADAVADIHDDSTILVSGFGVAGQAIELLEALTLPFTQKFFS